MGAVDQRPRGIPARGQLFEGASQPGGQISIGQGDLGEQGLGHGPERAAQLTGVQRADERAGHGRGDLRRQLVQAPSLMRGHAMAQAGERKDVIPDTADHVLRLPYPAARDARPRVQRVEPAQANELRRGGRVRHRPLRRAAEQQPERRRDGTELRRRCESDVHLQGAGQQGHAVDGRAAGHVQVIQGPVIAVHQVGPVGYNRSDVGPGGDAERQVNVRPAVLGSPRRRPGQRGARDALVGAGGRDQRVPQMLAFFGREHPRQVTAGPGWAPPVPRMSGALIPPAGQASRSSLRRWAPG
jgi:hypothetical protein